MFQVIKRDGSKADFTLTKINDAIMKAFTATQMSYNNDIIDLLALRVTEELQFGYDRSSGTSCYSGFSE